MPIRTARNISVLIADDHAVVREGLRMILENADGIDVVADVADGRQAVREARRLAPDVVVMDIGMPVVNGIEATRQIRAGAGRSHVVMLSMHATSEHIYQAFKAGALGYLLKDSAGKEVVEAVRVVANGERYISRRIAETMLDDYIMRRQPPKEAPLDRLSAREREVLQLVVEGRTSAQIGEAIHLSPSTVDSYRSRLMKKLGVRSLPELVRFAIANGMTTPE